MPKSSETIDLREGYVIFKDFKNAIKTKITRPIGQRCVLSVCACMRLCVIVCMHLGACVCGNSAVVGCGNGGNGLGGGGGGRQHFMSSSWTFSYLFL